MLRRWFGRGFEGHYAQGMEHFNQGRFAAALDAFDRVLSESTDPTHPTTALAGFYRAEALSRLGTVALAEDRDQEAVDYLDAALASQPGYPDLHFRRGLAALRAGDTRAAEQSARRAVDLNPDFAQAHALLLLAHRANGEEQRAAKERDLLRALAATRNHPLAQAATSEEFDLSDLLQHLLGEEDRRSRIRRAESLFHQGLWTQARTLLGELVTENPTFPDLRLRLGAVLFQLGEDGPAAEHVEAALDRNPGFADARILRGVLALRAGRAGEAVEDLVCGRAAGGPSPFCDVALAVAQVQCGAFADARTVLAPLVANAGAPPVARRLDALLTGLLRAEDGLANYEETLRREPSPALVLDAVGVALRWDRPDLASRFASRLPSAQTSSLAAVARIEALTAAGSSEALIGLIDAAVEAHPDDLALRLAAARGAMAANEPTRARLHLDRLTAADPPLPGVHLLWAGVFEHEGKLDQALASLAAEAAVPDRDLDLALRQLVLLRRTGTTGTPDAGLERWRRAAPLHPRVRLLDPEPWLAELVYPGTPADAREAIPR